MRRLLFPLLLLFAACSTKPAVTEFVPFRSPFGDFECVVPKGWEPQSSADRDVYRFVTWAGPEDPAALWGAARFVVTWHAGGKPFRKASGEHGKYDSVEDYLRQMTEAVWFPDPEYPEPRRAVMVGGRPGERLVVRVRKDAYMSLPGARPVSQGGGRMWRRDTAILIPTRGGFYTIVFPAAEKSHARYQGAFEKFVESFRFLKDSPLG